MRTSTETYDSLEFWIDTLKMDRWSGERAWQRVAFPVPGGKHRFSWRYIKDKSFARGEDGAWIDRITFPGSVVSNRNTGVVGILSPLSGNAPSAEEPVHIRVRNFGKQVLDTIPVAYVLNDSIRNYDTIFQPVQAMESHLHQFAGLLDLSAGGEHKLTVYTSLEGDNYRCNDTLAMTILSRWKTFAQTSLPNWFIY